MHDAIRQSEELEIEQVNFFQFLIRHDNGIFIVLK